MKLRLSMNESCAVTAVQVLLYTHAAVWVVFGTITTVKGIGGLDDGAAFSWVATALMFVNAALYLWTGYRIGNKKTGIYLFTLALLIINMFGTLTDELGIFDVLVLLLSLASLIMLMVKRRTFVPSQSSE